MKRTTVLLLLLAMLLTSNLSLTGHASPADSESETVTDSSILPPVAPTTEESATDPTDPESVDPPATAPAPETAEPAPPETSQPPITEPPITEPPYTEPPVTEPAPSEEELLFDALAAVIDAGESELLFSTPQELSDELIRTVCIRALEHTPRFFYLGGIDVAVTPLAQPDEAGNLYTYRIIPAYRFAPGEELDAAKAYVAEESAKILAQIPEDATDEVKLLFLHDYLCTHFAYDGSHTVGDLYSLLQSGHGVCQAYVYLYAYLLDQLAIPNAFAISAQMNHIWNLVKLDGQWYHIDLTWDDPTIDQAGRALHTNFLRSDQGIAETGHHGWSAPYACTSDLYEKSFLYDITGAVLFTRFGAYGISQSQRMLLKLDFDNLTSTPVVDLSDLRWGVWNKPGSLWKEQYINLYSDGSLVYFNGPDTVWSFDPEMNQVELLFTYDSQNGYLYSLSGDGHTLTCTVSTAPGASERTVRFTTPHIFAAEGGFFFSTHTCVVCEYSELYLSPQNGDFITACLSSRESDDNLHDLRLILLVDREMLEEYPPLTVRFILRSADDERWVTTTVSHKDYGLFLTYERVYAGGRQYAVADGYEMLGLIIRGLEHGSYDSVTVTVTAEDYEIYSSTVSADLLFPATEEPPITTDPPATEEPPVSADLPDQDTETEESNTDADPDMSNGVEDTDANTEAPQPE